VTLIARDMQTRPAQDVLPMVASVATVSSDDALWVSEAAQDKFGYKLGQLVSLAIAGASQRFIVAGVWRDYARANGSLVISRQRYVEITADRSANEGAVWIAPGANAAQIQSAIRARFGSASALEMMHSSEVRDRSLLVFDRAFAVTYALEALAVIIGLAGISVAASFTAITRRMEFGMLRHIGLRRGQVVQMLATEGIATAILGTAYGLALGFALSLVLIFVINRQSFNWSIDLSIPVLQLATFAVALIVAAAVTAVISGRAALGVDAVRAVREDW
jgi:putative ABC transport system permease protein